MACGVLLRATGEVLIAQRPPGKIAAGAWEFPGGKIEAGESVRTALERELHEELGVTVLAARPLIRFTHAYSDRIVDLETWLIEDWDAEPHARESQHFEWRRPDAMQDLPLLPTVEPILRRLRLPEDYVFTPPHADERRIRAGLAQLPARALLRLRLPALSAAVYEQLARRLLPDCRALGLSLILDRGADMALELGASGWHLREAELASDPQQPRPPGLRLMGSAHSRSSLERLRDLGADAAVLGTVRSSPSHAGQAALGWDGFSAMTQDLVLPIYAIGGLSGADKPQAFAAGAQGVAGISAYWSRGS